MRKQNWRLAASIGIALVAGLGLSACRPATSSRVHEVTIDTTSYSPQTLEVAVGDTIVWTNRDLLVHTVTTPDKGLDSRDIAAGESWRFEVSTPLDLDYLCTYHPTMRGSLRAR